MCVCIVNNPSITLAYLDQNQLTANLFELWVHLIPHMKYDFEWRRSMMAFLSLFLMQQSSLNTILSSNLGFILKKIIYFGEKLMENITRKRLNGDPNCQDLDGSQVKKYKIFFLIRNSSKKTL